MRKRFAGLTTLAPLCQKISKPALKKYGFAQASILLDWPKIVGSCLGQYSTPEKMTFPQGKRTNGTLVVQVNSAFALELQHLIPIVLEKINNYFGYQAISKLSLRQVNAPASLVHPLVSEKNVPEKKLTQQEHEKIEATLRPLDDSPLHQTLKKFGEAIYSKK
ncbi:MAG: DUF721 domain-containing protein [Alphaproteobacteria bacterium]|jgi:hypothetical protein|nr:DUF721 domain-containing protein [Alphaproteobacteria bacterium]MBT5390254.1 DUF721 domain-containing protein [Alphaproteobacteria bacterium]MBT5540016.1 DUF721 domain-containing protein [Alphaproteobacteria bacterium]MBT5654540.1 DUF721 domain-containing protein [Alphaproteobacteria bacterium]